MIELGKSYDCGTCNAICCRAGTRMVLKQADVEFMQAGGTNLTELEPPVEESTRRVKYLPLLTVTKPSVDGRYMLENDCGYLEDGEDGQPLCGAYEDPGRPDTCEAFEPGGYNCRTMRAIAGIDEPDEYDLFLQQTAGG